MSQQEKMVLEELGHSEVFSVFVFGYNSHFDCLIRYFLSEEMDEYQKFEEYESFHKSYSLFIENFKKVEDTKKVIFDYLENATNYYEYNKETGQITYKKTSDLNSKFDDFITAVYRTYLTFFEFINRFDVNKNDLHKEYYSENDTSDKKRNELYNYLCDQNPENEKFFKMHFKAVKEIFMDIKERRNYGIDHNFLNKKLELKGKLTYVLDEEGKVAGFNPPTTSFKGKETNIFEYTDYIFSTLMINFQHIVAMYSNSILAKKYKSEDLKTNPLHSYFHNINFLKKLYKDANIEFPTHFQILSEYQTYLFGSFMDNQFVKMNCSGFIKPQIKYQNHIELNIREPYFSQIKNGQKTIEGRMSAKKFREIKKGDRILINKRLPVLVEEVRNFKSFEEMFDIYGLKNCLPDIQSTEDGLNVYNGFYKKEDIAKHGVVAIKLLVQNY